MKLGVMTLTTQTWCALALPVLSLFACAAAPDSDWRDYGKDSDKTRFSALDQINRTNISKLRVAWTYHAGNNSDSLKTSMECTPLIVAGVMYVTSPVLEVIALDAGTGREIWKFNPFPERPSYARAWAAAIILVLLMTGAVLLIIRSMRSRAALVRHAPVWMLAFTMLASGAPAKDSGLLRRPKLLADRVLRHLLPNPMEEERRLGPNRGLTYWEDGQDKRIFFAGGRRLVALDARTGRPVATFGKNGFVNLTQNLERSIDGLLFSVTSPPVICRDVLVIGSLVAEGPEPAAPGYVQGLDVRSGERRWVFHTIPKPGETGYDTWPADAWKQAGGANAWGGMTADDQRGLVFLPIGSATFDFYGGDRIGKNLFSDSLVAIRAATGELVWSYQMIHHDLWDYDLACPPNLVTLRRDGKPVDAVVQPLKNGLIFVLNRDTGTPLFPVEERAVPASDLEGEQTWRTQPFPLKPAPLSRLEITESDLTDLSPAAHASALEKFRTVSGAAIYAPPSRRGTIVTPGFDGGVNWGGGALDPRTSRLIVNSNDVPYLLEMTDAKPKAGFKFGFRGFFRFLDPDGYPAIKPPWGKLTAIDLTSGDVVWQAPLGEYKELTARGVPVTGTENAGGPIVTAGGVVFIAATKDRAFRAFDVDTGKVLWQTELHAAGHATPATYAVKGKQYVVLAAGGGSIAESPSGDEYVAFALSDEKEL
ncbi:MAG TPA: pyrroloquinoline quinone-dependent dehydrogenase [Bryobacteraceae bacterium]|nr:pyrroloquinoline quinone-dependent dehydrogenase [Bryobacteraceae bacterium]